MVHDPYTRIGRKTLDHGRAGSQNAKPAHVGDRHIDTRRSWNDHLVCFRQLGELSLAVQLVLLFLALLLSLPVGFLPHFLHFTAEAGLEFGLAIKTSLATFGSSFRTFVFDPCFTSSSFVVVDRLLLSLLLLFVDTITDTGCSR